MPTPPASFPPDNRPVLLTGATGYVGGRLLPRLETRGPVRCLSRSPGKLAGRTAAGTRLVEGDVTDPESLARAMEGVGTAYYLVHAMDGAEDFAQRDRVAAETFLQSATAAGVERVIYLGGLGEESADLSPHLESRQEVGRILRAGTAAGGSGNTGPGNSGLGNIAPDNSGPDVVELRAAVVLGAGSLSFSLIRALAERLPVLVCPRWVETPTQPIAVDDVLDYLIAAADLPPPAADSPGLRSDGGRVFEIGGEVTTYGGMIREYARRRGLRRLMVPVPLLTPYFSSLWLGLVTPTGVAVGRHLLEGLRNPTVVRDRAAERAFPALHPVGVGEAIRRALAEPQ